MFKTNFNIFSLNENEKVILKKLLDDPSKYIQMTTLEICKSLYLSKSTFLRFLKKIKINTMKNLKKILLSELNSIYKNSAISDIFQKNIQKNESYIKKDTFMSFLKEIEKYDYVWLVGVSSNYYLIKIIEMYLRKCGINAISINSWEKINLKINYEKMSIVIFSRSMNSSDVKKIRKKVSKDLNLNVFAITENSQNFTNIQSIKINSYSPLMKMEKEIPLFYHWNILTIFIASLNNYIIEESLENHILQIND